MVETAGNFTYDVREDDEQYQKLQDCVDLLLASGYFRARIKGLPAFDKIVGGMVWCISICNFSVDVDLLYAENATIGQKIALTEKIVAVLPQLQCPHPIEPHQIQGLDFIHIFPVIQWLVKRAIEVKKEHGDDLVTYSDYLTAKGFPTEENELCQRFENLVQSAAPERVRKRGPATKPANLVEDALCTLAEFKSGSSHGHAVEDAEEDTVASSLEQSSQRDRISTKTYRKILDSVVTLPSSNPIDEMDDLDRQIALVTLEAEKLEKELLSVQETTGASGSRLAELRGDHQRIQKLLASYSEEEITEMEQLLQDYDSKVQREKAFKTACREELAKMEEEIALLSSADSLTDDNKTSTEKRLLTELQEAEDALAKERLKLAEVSRTVALLQRQLDSVPSQLELTQYQQRFIELYNQMASKHRQTKQYFTLHNTLIDVRNFMKKEIDLLNKIEEVLPMATKESYRDSFVQNLQEILRLVEGNHEKISVRTVELERQKSDLSVEFAQLKDNEREFHRTSEKFRQACRRNEELHNKLNNRP